MKRISSKPILVVKLGGATLATPELIKVAAKHLAETASHHQLIVAVSAMGTSTDQLISLSKQVSAHPPRREMDMLLSTGERISMALLSMALNELSVSAISFTGSQAGVFTNDSHECALIQDIRASRVEQALLDGKVVIVAGFQGVSPQTKEITTLGRGGTDTTAVALAAYFKAAHCEILKDVPGVFSADPKLIPQATLLQKLNYQTLIEMTFWGAKVLHYRSVELAQNAKVKVFIGPVLSKVNAIGTWISSEALMYEQVNVIAVNSHETVGCLKIPSTGGSPYSDIPDAIKILKILSDKAQVSFPQVLLQVQGESKIFCYFTGPKEVLAGIQNCKIPEAEYLDPTEMCSVTATANGSTSIELQQKLSQTLHDSHLTPFAFSVSGQSLSFFFKKSDRERAVQALHKLTEGFSGS